MGINAFAYRSRSKVIFLLLLVASCATSSIQRKSLLTLEVTNAFSWNAVTVTMFCNQAITRVKVPRVEMGQTSQRRFNFNRNCNEVTFRVEYLSQGTVFSYPQSIPNVSKWCVYIASTPNHNRYQPCDYRVEDTS